MLSSKTKRWSAAGFIFIGIVVGVIFASNFNWTTRGFASRDSNPVVLGSQQNPPEEVLRLQDTGKAFTAVSKAVLPTVVSISTSRIIKRSPADDQFFAPLFKNFFGKEFKLPQPETQRLKALGSGVIVSKEGYILTNNHVIKDADDIKVTLYDKRTFEAKLVGTDPLTEVAVIKIKGENLPVARLGNSDELEVGEWVLAIGNPLGLFSTVTAGIVSAKGRSVGIIRDSNLDQNKGSYAIENFIQTDAAINPGNSGGALVNLQAEVVGINTAIATTTGYYEGYGFAIPINLARKIMNDLIQHGYVVRAWLGIAMRPVDETIAERFKLDKPRGVLIEQVLDQSPAEKAGLKALDIILKVDGKEVNQSNEVQNDVVLKNPGDMITLTVLRNGAEKNIRVKLGQRKTGEKGVKIAGGGTISKLGLKVQNLTDEIRSNLRAYDNDKGVIVTEVKPYTTVADAGIQKYDLITRIEKYPIRSVSDYRKALRKFKGGEVVIFYLKRKDTVIHAFVKLPK